VRSRRLARISNPILRKAALAALEARPNDGQDAVKQGLGRTLWGP
jgi:hypothetical protein